MVSIDTNLCLQFYGFVLKTKYFIPICLFKIVGRSNFQDFATKWLKY